MKKLKATRILNQLKAEHDETRMAYGHIQGEPCEECDDEFITVYYNIGNNKDLRWCNTVKEALEVIEELPNSAKIALDISDEFME